MAARMISHDDIQCLRIRNSHYVERALLTVLVGPRGTTSQQAGARIAAHAAPIHQTLESYETFSFPASKLL